VLCEAGERVHEAADAVTRDDAVAPMWFIHLQDDHIASDEGGLLHRRPAYRFSRAVSASARSDLIVLKIRLYLAAIAG
jgi:hypothetical protein